MKALKVVVLILVTSVFASAQSRSDAEATYALKGPVRTFRIEAAKCIQTDGSCVEGPRVLQLEASFNEDGNRTDLRIYNDQGSLVRRIEMKFDGRKMIEAINYDGAGKAWLRIVQAYDDAGRMKERKTYDGDGSLRSSASYKRNERGLLIEFAESSASGVLLEQINYRYDGPKLLGHERKLYRPNGSLISTAVYTAATKRVETTTFNPDGSVANKVYRDNWDFAEFGADGSLQKVTAVSSEHRLVDEMVTLNKDGSKTREAELPDQLDAHGNWTRKTQWLTDAKGTRAVKVTYRALTYY